MQNDSTELLHNTQLWTHAYLCIHLAQTAQSCHHVVLPPEHGAHHMKPAEKRFFFKFLIFKQLIGWLEIFMLYLFFLSWSLALMCSTYFQRNTHTHAHTQEVVESKFYLLGAFSCMGNL
jgi:hypothetical protein